MLLPSVHRWLSRTYPHLRALFWGGDFGQVTYAIFSLNFEECSAINLLRASVPRIEKPRRRHGNGLLLLALEPRYLFDGAAAATAAGLVHQADHPGTAPYAPDPLAEALANHVLPVDPTVNVSAPVQVRAPDAVHNGGKKEVVFVDTNIPAYQTLADGVRTGVEVDIIDGGQAGLAQLAKWAESHTGYDAIHLITHGSEATLNLGTDRVTNDSLPTAVQRVELAEIGHALNAGGDLLLYGCDVARGSDGQQLIAAIATTTGRDVAASIDRTGTAAMGGNWIFESRIGTVEAPVALTEAARDAYSRVLAPAHAAPSAEDLALIPDVSAPTLLRAADPAQDGGKREVVFIDSSVADYQTLVNGVRPGVEIELIGGGNDGLAQMALWAESHFGYDAIHVLSHGAQGSLFLGTNTLTDASVDTLVTQTELAEIGSALNAGGDLMLWGCDVGKGALGAAFVQRLARMSGANVASSSDTTGIDGDWILERSVGVIEAGSPLTTAAEESYAHDLIYPDSQGSSGNDIGRAIAVDASDNVYVTGSFTGTVDFDPGPGVTTMTSAGNTDIFIEKLSATGDLIWAARLGGSGADIGYGVTVDGSGNVYATGSFSGTADFNPGAGTANLTSNGGTDAFLVKLDSSGTYVWAKAIGGSDADIGHGIAVDGSGNVYATGSFSSTADFDPGAGVINLTSNGGTDVFIEKLDSSGTYVWAKALGGSANDIGNGVAVDGSGDVIAAGSFSGTADFDPSVNVRNRTSAGASDIFVLALNASGDDLANHAPTVSGIPDQALTTNITTIPIAGFFTDPDSDSLTYTATQEDGSALPVWLSLNSSTGIFTGFLPIGFAGLRLKVTASDYFGASVTSAAFNLTTLSPAGFPLGLGGGNVTAIATDGSGNVYVTGNYRGTVDFDPGVGTANLTSNGGADVFIEKLDSSGAYVWAKTFGAADLDRAEGIAVDNSGNVVVTGYFHDTVDFDPGAGTYSLSASVQDIFVEKLDSSGAFVWAKSFVGSTVGVGSGVAMDGSGNVYITGYYMNTVDFDPGAGVANLTSNGGTAVFIEKLDSSGNYVWAKAVGDTGVDSGNGIAVDVSGNVYTTGSFTGTVDFDPGPGPANLTGNNVGSVFIEKLDSSGNYVWAKAVAGSGTNSGNGVAVDGSGNVYTTGSFSGTADFDPGAGTANLTSNGGTGVFIEKLDSSGNYVWAKGFGGTGNDAGTGIVVDGSRNVFVTGTIIGSLAWKIHEGRRA